MSRRKRNVSHVPPCPEEFAAIMAGRMDISTELNEFWRQCTDDQLATWFRDAAQYSYVVRAPNREVVADGKGSTPAECEERAISHAEEYVEENAMVVLAERVNAPCFSSYVQADASSFEFDHHWNWRLLGEWRFVLWPPQNNSVER